MLLYQAVRSGVARKIIKIVKISTKFENVYFNTKIPEENISQILNDLRKELGCEIKENPTPITITEIIENIEFARD